jgi:hypothetical protein
VKKTIVLLACLCLPISALADTHYVSPYGNNTLPYDSWATAADSIQKGINAASYGDTVMVGAGTYREYGIVMTSGISLIGAGMDSCVIDARDWSQDAPVRVIWGADSSSIEGFHIVGDYSPPFAGRAVGVEDHYGIPLRFIKDNKLTNLVHGMFLRKCPQVVNNLIDTCHIGIDGSFDGCVIANNTITNCVQGISGGLFNWYAKIVNNLIYSVGSGVRFGDNDSLVMSGNLVYDVTMLYAATFGNPDFTIRQQIYNNTFSGRKPYDAVSCGGNADLRNNIVLGGAVGIKAWGAGVVVTVAYNDLWGSTQTYLSTSGGAIDTSEGGNIYLDPMFLGGDDYHLQYASPCIDAGDPSIKDPDSSRSDMGCFGGTWGEIYTYQDYPPTAPDSLRALSLNDVTVLSWKPNTECDLSHYLVYRDMFQGFIPDTFKIAGNVPKDSSVFRDYHFVLGQTYYYRVSAWDQTGHESAYSDELEVMATSVGEYVEAENRPPMSGLSQNYPNPFNSTTVIWYYLPDVGYQPAEVEIVIYNVLGRKVRTLVKERKYPGRHNATWDGKDDQGDDLGSGIYFYRLTFSGVDLYPLVKPKKMVLLK